jgi:hypothetical protein
MNRGYEPQGKPRIHILVSEHHVLSLKGKKFSRKEGCAGFFGGYFTSTSSTSKTNVE